MKALGNVAANNPFMNNQFANDPFYNQFQQAVSPYHMPNPFLNQLMNQAALHQLGQMAMANQAFGRMPGVAAFPFPQQGLPMAQQAQLGQGLQQFHNQNFMQAFRNVLQELMRMLGIQQPQRPGANQAFGQGAANGANQAFGQGAMNGANQAFGQGAMGALNPNAKNVKWAAQHGGYNWDKNNPNRVNFTKGQFKGGHGMVDGQNLRVYDKDGKHVANQPLKQKQKGKGTHKVASPLTFDLNGNGKVDTTGISKKFDINGDGKVDQSAWAGKGDGVLAFDNDGDGKFGEDGTELFGNNTGGQNNYANGFEALSAFASKKLGKEAIADGKLDKKELAALDNHLRMKVDGQDKKLSELGVDSINLRYEEAGKNADANGNEHRQTGAFTQNGEQRNVNDVWFQYQ
ncbi:MAG: hypothetical protein VYC39_08310 [Myxococcota bacterium]|nr:hypothetical protein [Myxococcota bacterium]